MFKDIDIESLYNQKVYTENSSKFWQLYAKYLDVENKEVTFELLKDQFADLAKRGELQAIALYLSNIQPNNQDVDLDVVNLAKKIEQKSVKTPEEWEVVAALHSHDKVEVECYDYLIKHRSLKTLSMVEFKKFIEKVSDLSVTLFYHKYHAKDSMQYYIDYCNMIETYKNTKYAKAQGKAIAGYFLKYFKCGEKVADACAYYRLTEGINKQLINNNELKNTDIKLKDRKYFSKIIQANVKKCIEAVGNKKTSDIASLIAISSALCHSENKKVKNLGAQVIKDIANGNIKPDIKGYNKEAKEK